MSLVRIRDRHDLDHLRALGRWHLRGVADRLAHQARATGEIQLMRPVSVSSIPTMATVISLSSSRA